MMGLLGGLAGGLGNMNSSRTPSYLPAQQKMQGVESNALTGILQNPASSPAYSAMAGGINSNFNTLGDQMSTQAQSRGFGSSGMLGSNLQKNDFARQGALGNSISGIYDNALNMGNQFSFANPGQPGSAAAGAISGTGSGLAEQMMLAAMGGQNGSGGGLMQGNGGILGLGL